IVDYDRLISSKNWERMNEDFGNIGYKEGILEGKDITIQEGFNKGYVEELVLEKKLVEYYKPLLNSTNVDDSNIILPTQSTIDRLKSLENDLANLTVEKNFTKSYFKATLLTDSTCSCSEKSDSTMENCCKNNNMDDLEVSNVGNESESCLSSQQSVLQAKSPEQILAEYREKVKI
ncbi:4982_t:CDS:2, partial [Gigaspora rosea]